MVSILLVSVLTSGAGANGRYRHAITQEILRLDARTGAMTESCFPDGIRS
jgi:hypothetical protein